LVTLTSGCSAGRSPVASKCVRIAASIDSCIASPSTDLPNIFFISAAGALPFRKPFIWKSLRASSSFSLTLASSSVAGTVIE
jgi:hypothetical protein